MTDQLIAISHGPILQSGASVLAQAPRRSRNRLPASSWATVIHSSGCGRDGRSVRDHWYSAWLSSLVVGRRRYQLARKPPSTHRLCPTTNDAASEASQTTASATSAGLPIRRTGKPAATALMSAMPELIIIGVSIRPGDTALMRMRWDAYSSAAERVSETTAALDAE